MNVPSRNYNPSKSPSYQITGCINDNGKIQTATEVSYNDEDFRRSIGTEKYEKLKHLLTKLITSNYLCNHQADAVIGSLSASFNTTTQGFILADQPGVGKTRILIAMAIAHAIVHEKPSLIIVSNQGLKTAMQNDIQKNKENNSLPEIPENQIQIKSKDELLKEGCVTKHSFKKVVTPQLTKSYRLKFLIIYFH